MYFLPPFLRSCNEPNDVLKGEPTNKDGFSHGKSIVLIIIIAFPTKFRINIFVLPKNKSGELLDSVQKNQGGIKSSPGTLAGWK